MLEEGAVAQAPSMAARRYAGNPLINAVLRQTKAQSKTFRRTYRLLPRRPDQPATRLQPARRGRGLEEALQVCGQLADLLEKKFPASQAEEFKDWLLAIGESVASAAAEGGFVAVGGELGSQAEATALHAMRDALRVRA
jgi:hypothetical protein